MSIPSAEAWSALLLKPLDPPEHIPGLAVLAQSKAASAPELTRSASSLQLPPDATVIGSESASALVTADGFTHMRGEGLHWSVFTGEALQPEGLRICISDGRRSVRIGQGSRASFGEGHASFTQTLGMLQIRLTIACDPTTRTMVQVTNTSSEAREIFVSDLLLPSMQPDGTSSPLSVERIDDRALLGPADMHGSRLCHTVCADAPCTVSPCTRCDAFARQPAEALCTAGKQEACMGFACRLLIEKGSCAAAAFATALVCGSVPEHMRFAPGEEQLMSVARIYAGIQAEHIGTSPEMAMRSMYLTGAVLWHGLAHQGAAEPLHVSAADLCALGVDAKLPFVLLSLQHDDYAEMLDDTLIFAALLHMRGWPVAVVILCREAMEDDVCRTLGCVPTACTSGLTITVLVSEHLQEGTRAALEAAARLILCSGYDALAQLRQCVKRLYRLDSFACPAASAADISGLLFSDEYGGFEPHTKAYIQYVHQGSPTASWTRMLSGRHIGMRISYDGISGTFAGPVLKTQLTSTEIIFAEEDGMRFSPCGFPYGHAQYVIHTPGAAEWHATAAELDMQLICAVMPDGSAGIRLWRLHNTSRRTRTLTLHAVASFIMGEADGSLTAVTSLSNLAIAASPSSGLHGFLAAPEGGYETLTMSTGSLRATLGLHGAFAEAQHEGIGCAVLLRRPLTLAPDETHEAVFVIGAAKTSDEIESMLVTVRSRGATALIESAQSAADTKLDRLIVTTPDDAFNLMMNRLLPAFLLAPYPAQLPFAHLLAAAAFLPCGSHRMQSALLCAFARPPKSVRERLLLALLAAWYISRTGDEDVLHAPIPVTDDTRDDRCTLLLHMMRLLTGVKLAPDGLPLTKQHSDLTAGLMYIAALKAFQPFLPEDDQPDAQRMTEMVTAAAERALPDDASCLASCWAVFAGLRPSLPRACEPADFSETIPYLHALCMTEQYDDAWKLIGWLNPVLHHDTVTPAWQPEPDGSQMASAWLYVTILEQLLGLQRHGDKLQLKPHLPEDWHECTIAMQVGASRWYITLTDDVRLIQTDGVISGGDSIVLTDDGLEHHVRWPLNRR